MVKKAGGINITSEFQMKRNLNNLETRIKDTSAKVDRMKAKGQNTDKIFYYLVQLNQAKNKWEALLRRL